MAKCAKKCSSAGAAALLLWLGVLPALVAASEQEAEQLYKRAFRELPNGPERVGALERLVRQYPNTCWADDALWVLGETARQQGQIQRAVLCWQYLMARKQPPWLEEFTKTQEVYAKSFVPRLAQLLEAEGLAYLPEAAKPSEAETYRGNAFLSGVGAERVWVGCRPVNVVQMYVWAELGRCYEEMGKPDLAVAAYRKALEASPERATWAQVCRQRLLRLERLQQESAPAVAETQTPPGGVRPPALPPQAVPRGGG